MNLKQPAIIGTSCVTRHSGSVVKTSCSSTYRGHTYFSHGTSYRSGSGNCPVLC
jgi:hypothetical protein